MKKKLIILLTLIAILFIYYGEERNFYCLSEGKCVTVWKTYGNTCYIIPYKYYGLYKPSGNYMITTNTNDIDIIWENNSDKIILTSDEESKIINSKAKQIIIDYNSNKQHYSQNSLPIAKLLALIFKNHSQVGTWENCFGLI